MMQHNYDFCTKFMKSIDKILTQSSKELLPNMMQQSELSLIYNCSEIWHWRASSWIL